MRTLNRPSYSDTLTRKTYVSVINGEALAQLMIDPDD